VETAFRYDQLDGKPHDPSTASSTAERRPTRRRARCPSASPSRTNPPEAAARRVRSIGEIRGRGDLIAISTALAGEAVAVEETEDGQWLVRFYDAPVRLIDGDKKRLRRLPVAADRDGEAQDKTKP
jgi:putative transposase